MILPKLLGYVSTLVRSFNLLSVLITYNFLENNNEIYFLSNILLIAFSCAPVYLWIVNNSIVNKKVKYQSDLITISIFFTIPIFLFYCLVDNNNLISISTEHICISIIYILFFTSGLCFENIKNAEGSHFEVIKANSARNLTNMCLLIILYLLDKFQLTYVLYIFLLSEIIKNLIIGSLLLRLRINFNLAITFGKILFILLPFQLNSLVDRNFLLLFEDGSDLTPLLYAERFSFIIYNGLFSGFLIHIHPKMKGLTIEKKINLSKQFTKETIDKRYIFILFLILIISSYSFIKDLNLIFISGLMTFLFVLLMPLRFCSGLLNRIAFEGIYKLALCIILYLSVPINYTLNHLFLLLLGPVGIVMSTALLEILIFLSISLWIYRNENKKNCI